MTTLTEARPALAEPADLPLWDSEAFVLRGADRAALADEVRGLEAHLDAHPETNLTDLAFTLNRDLLPGGTRLGVVAKNVGELRTRLKRAAERLADPACEQIRDTSGIYWFAKPLAEEGKVAFLFPGEGAQYPGMLRDVIAAFPEASAFLTEYESGLARVRPGEPAVSSLFLSRGDPEAEAAMRRLDNTMLSVLFADGALFRVLEKLGLRPAFAAGHSMGEMAALSAAGCVRVDEGYVERFAATMKELTRQEEESEEGFALLAVGAGMATVSGLLDGTSVYLAMDNCPHQTVLVGVEDEITQVQARLAERGLVCERLPFRRPYHTPLFAPSIGPLRALFNTVDFVAPSCVVYSCTTAEPFPEEPALIRDLAIRHWAEPVRFTQMVEAMHDAGARLFVEVGPRGNLSAFVEDALRGRRFAALPANVARRSGLTQLNHLVAQLAAHGVTMSLSELYAPRAPRVVELRAAEPEGSGDRAEVMRQYLTVMEQFLDTQREVTEAFLGRPSAVEQAASLLVEPEQAGSLLYDGKRPLLGDIVRHLPGQEVVTRRRLDLAEDTFALDHTVGGRMVSQCDPNQHGVPVMPMTFTLEVLAECAALLAPGRVVSAIRQIRLLRWLAFEAGEPSEIEVSAKLEGEEDGVLRVKAEVRDLGPIGRPDPKRPRVASGVVYLTTEYPPAPPPGGLPGENIQPISMTVEQVYHNLFHGPMFQGVTNTVRAGDTSIEAGVEVLPRERLFHSTQQPTFTFDPVLLDVVLHPLATWHLHQPDLAGRIMLPVGVEAAEFYAPPAAPGTRLTSRSWISDANLRSFSHDGEVIDGAGAVYLRLRGMKCWRFYVPFGEVNFHGPKDQYFLGRRWAGTKADNSLALVRLDIPPDLKQSAMSRVTAQVTLTANELVEYRKRTLAGDDVPRWLFDRIAAKDAIRLLWYDRTGERLYPADIECHGDGDTFTAHRRGVPGDTFDSATLARTGDIVAAISPANPSLAVSRSEEPPSRSKQLPDGDFTVAFTESKA